MSLKALKGLIHSVMVRKGFLIVLVVLVSCGKKDKLPPGVLSQEKMVNVLSEIYIAEDRVSHLGLKPDSAQYVFKALQTRVFDKIGVPDSVFKTSIDYYMDHPKEMELIYTALVDSLNLKEQRSTFPAAQQ